MNTQYTQLNNPRLINNQNESKKDSSQQLLNVQRTEPIPHQQPIFEKKCIYSILYSNIYATSNNIII